LAPESIVVLAGSAQEAEALPPYAGALQQALRAQRFAGTLQFIDLATNGTLADLARTRADLAIIALPTAEVGAALEIAGRMNCRSPLVIGSGTGAREASELMKIARREGMQLLGPNSLGLQRPQRQLNASALGPLARAGSLALVSQSGALTSAMLDWAT